MSDAIRQQVESVTRTVEASTHEGGEVWRVGLVQTYPAPLAALWSAVSTLEAVSSWFTPVTGEARLDASFLLSETGTVGRVLTCTEQEGWTSTWENDDDVSWLEVGVSADLAGSTVSITHLCRPNEHWVTYGPAAVGLGYDLGLRALGLYLAGILTQTPAELEEWSATPEGRRLGTLAAACWAEAHEAAGADPEVAATTAARSRDFYAGV